MTKIIKADVDIDLADRNDIISKITHIPASIINEKGVKKHVSGVYFQNIPTDPETGLASIDYNEASKFGFIKIDFLNNSVYKDINSYEELKKLEESEPLWELLENEEFVKILPHLSGHYEKVVKFKPKNIHELAALLALIRPAKRKLLNLSKEQIMKKIWEKGDEKGYSFKKSHSYAYAKMIMVFMNKITNYLLNL